MHSENNCLIESGISRLSYNWNCTGDGVAIGISYQSIQIALTYGSHIHELNGNIILKNYWSKITDG